MYRVLLAVDGKESRVRTQAEAIRKGAADDYVVDVLHVHEETSLPDAEWAVGGFFETYAEELSEAGGDVDRLPPPVRGAIEAAADVFENAGIEYAVHETVGSPAEAIIEGAARLDSDEIVLGVSKHTPVGKVLFGSVTQAVILDSRWPVTVVPDVPE